VFDVFFFTHERFEIRLPTIAKDPGFTAVAALTLPSASGRTLALT
jgi:hypothetical protein